MSQTEIQVSVIIPVYKVEEYIERCIRSVGNQNIPFHHYEIIAVNDGSPDNCREIILRLTKEFPNLMLIDQENRGVSMARNAGIDRATGKFLLFVDPDDYLVPNALQNGLDAATASGAQLCFLGYTFLDVRGDRVADVFNNEMAGQIFTGREAYYVSRGDGMTDPDRSVGVLFDRGFLGKWKLRYVPGIPYLEDGEFLARALCLADRCIFSGKHFYMRTTRPGSATNSRMILSEKAINGFFIAARYLQEFQLSDGLTTAQREFLNQPIAKFILLPFNALALSFDFRGFMKLTRDRFVSDLQINLAGVHKTYLRYGRVFNWSKPLLFFYMIYNVYKRLWIRRMVHQ